MSGGDPWYHADIPFTADAEEIILRIASVPAAGVTRLSLSTM